MVRLISFFFLIFLVSFAKAVEKNEFGLNEASVEKLTNDICKGSAIASCRRMVPEMLSLSTSANLYKVAYNLCPQEANSEKKIGCFKLVNDIAKNPDLSSILKGSDEKAKKALALREASWSAMYWLTVNRLCGDGESDYCIRAKSAFSRNNFWGMVLQICNDPKLFAIDNKIDKVTCYGTFLDQDRELATKTAKEGGCTNINRIECFEAIFRKKNSEFEKAAKEPDVKKESIP